MGCRTTGFRLVDYSSTPIEELIRACAESNDGAAWNEFVFRFQRPIQLSIIRTASQWCQPPQQALDDLVQETYLKLCADKCRLLLQFAVQHPESVVRYVKVIAVNVAHDYFKSRFSQKRGAGQASHDLAKVDAPGQSYNAGGQESIERQVLLRQIAEVLETCSAGPDQQRDSLIFWLYYRQGMSAKAIAAVPTIGLTPKGVESAILRLTRLVRDRLAIAHAKAPNEKGPEQKGFRPAESY